ncbi:MAG: class II aldolase/adducin family protein, partial [Thermofilum sp.]|jgi:L-fuculose-phosphate aldolase|nr:class II aldolase/adducin family protein [Thermofilum sp.]
VGEDLFLLSPSGVWKARMKPEDVLLVTGDGKVLEGNGKPSVEFKTHVAIYRARRDVKAVVHAHPIYAGIIAAKRVDIEPVLEELTFYVGGTIRVASYAPSGTEELARNAVEALGDKKAVILANHGVVACGSSLEEALAVLGYVERAAKVAVYSMLIGGVHPLPREAETLERELYVQKLHRAMSQ